MPSPPWRHVSTAFFPRHVTQKGLSSPQYIRPPISATLDLGDVPHQGIQLLLVRGGVRPEPLQVAVHN
eukprot:3910490-Alexandrium_andersonii.AAC.1